jgi:hypothetical protein
MKKQAFPTLAWLGLLTLLSLVPPIAQATKADACPSLLLFTSQTSFQLYLELMERKAQYEPQGRVLPKARQEINFRRLNPADPAAAREYLLLYDGQNSFAGTRMLPRHRQTYYYAMDLMGKIFLREVHPGDEFLSGIDIGDTVTNAGFLQIQDGRVVMANNGAWTYQAAPVANFFLLRELKLMGMPPVEQVEFFGPGNKEGRPGIPSINQIQLASLAQEWATHPDQRAAIRQRPFVVELMSIYPELFPE